MRIEGQRFAGEGLGLFCLVAASGYDGKIEASYALIMRGRAAVVAFTKEGFGFGKVAEFGKKGAKGSI